VHIGLLSRDRAGGDRDVPTQAWLKSEFVYGYKSGNILAWLPDRRRRGEEKRSGGSYRRVFRKAVLPHLRSDSVVLELGPGAGSWSEAILKCIPEGVLYTIDFQDVTKWLRPDRCGGRLICYKVDDNSFSCIKDNAVDFFWSFGVLCHNNADHVMEILENALPKMKLGGVACHHYADWEKLDSYGWQRGGVPPDFKEKLDDEIWWPRSSQHAMQQIAERAGWEVLSPDLDLLGRDGLILMRRGEQKPSGASVSGWAWGSRP
jgi:hypothetical protein